VILCPAQFGTEEDYKDLKADLKSRGFALYPAPLSRFDWLRIVPSTFTKEFFTAELRPKKALGFFYEALDKALARVEADFAADVPISVLGHSIGGWVARSYIGEVLGQEDLLPSIVASTHSAVAGVASSRDVAVPVVAVMVDVVVSGMPLQMYRKLCRFMLVAGVTHEEVP